YFNPVNQGQRRRSHDVVFTVRCGVLRAGSAADTQVCYARDLFASLAQYLIPRFGGHRLCDISRVEVQQYLLEKLRQGFAWETTNHLRHVANSRKVNDLRIKTSCLPEFHKWGLS